MQTHSNFRLLVVRLGAMGDILHALPAVTALRIAHPDWRIDWAVEPRWRALLAAESAPPSSSRTSAQPLIDLLHFAATKAWRKTSFSRQTRLEFMALRAALRGGEYDAVIDLQGALRSALIASLAGCRRLIGEENPRERPARWLFTERVATHGAHVIEQDLELASAIAGDALKPVLPWLPIDPVAEAWADGILPPCYLERKQSGIESHPNILSQKFAEEIHGETAGPSTAFAAKNAPNFAQDDRYLLNEFTTQYPSDKNKGVARVGHPAEAHRLPGPKIRTWGTQYSENGQLNDGQTAVLINPGAGWGAKRWPAERYAAVAQGIIEQGCRVLINVGPGEEPLAEVIVRQTAGAATALTCSLAQLIALTRRVALTIAGDTGPLHLACALGVPVVGVYGPTDPSRNGPFGTRFTVLRSPQSRRDHSRYEAPEAGLLTIQPEEVLRAAGALLYP